jgi:peroxiredoxin
MRKSAIFIIILLVAFVHGCDLGPAGKIDKNNADFVLNDLDGNPMRLSDHRGKVVMLEFFASWCPPCRQAVPELSELYEKYRERGFELIAVSIDESVSDARDFVEEYGIKFTVVFDDRDVNAAFGVYNIPTTFILDRNGKVVNKHLGFAPGMGETFAGDIEALL